MLPVLFILPLLVLPFFDRGLTAPGFLWFLLAGPLIWLLFKRYFYWSPPQAAIWPGWWGLLFLQLGLATFFSIAGHYSMPGLMMYLAGFSYFLLGSSIGDQKLRPAAVRLIIMAGAALTAADWTIRLGRFFGWWSQDLGLLFPTWGHNQLAGWLVLAAPAAIAIGGKWPAAIITAGLILTGGRGALAGAAVGLVGLAAIRGGREQLRPALAAIILGLLIFIGTPLGLRLLGVESAPIINRPLAEDARVDYWKQGLRAIAARPFGWGVSTSRLVLPRFARTGEATSGSPHNQYLQSVLELGVVGGGLLIGLTAAALVIGRRSAAETQDLPTAAIWAGLVGSAVSGLFGLDWEFPSIFTLFWLMAGMIAAGQRKLSAKWPAAGLTITAIYAAAVLLTGLWLNPDNLKLLDFPARLHPSLVQKSIDAAKTAYSPRQFSDYIFNHYHVYESDNFLLAQILGWQETAPTTAAMMLKNDPQNQAAKQVLLGGR